MVEILYIENDDAQSYELRRDVRLALLNKNAEFDVSFTIATNVSMATARLGVKDYDLIVTDLDVPYRNDNRDDDPDYVLTMLERLREKRIASGRNSETKALVYSSFQGYTISKVQYSVGVDSVVSKGKGGVKYIADLLIDINERKEVGIGKH